MQAGIAQVVERAVETRESLIRSQVPAPLTYPRSSTDEQRATNAMGVGSNPSEGATISTTTGVGRMWRVIVGHAGSTPAATQVAQSLHYDMSTSTQLRCGPDA